MKNQKNTVPAIGNSLDMHDNFFQTMADDELVCYCAKVTKGNLLAAVAKGCATLEQLKAVTGLCPPDKDCAHKSPRGRCCCPEASALLAYALGKK